MPILMPNRASLLLQPSRSCSNSVQRMLKKEAADGVAFKKKERTATVWNRSHILRLNIAAQDCSTLS